jgi:hypothetical protein
VLAGIWLIALASLAIVKPADRSGMRRILFHSYGHSISQAGWHMAPFGFPGEQSRKLPGEKISDCG